MRPPPSRLSGLSTLQLALMAEEGRSGQPLADAEPIAIVGLGCRFPGAGDPAAYWALLRDGVDAITEVPGDRWNLSVLYDADPDRAGTMYTKHGGFLSGVDQFDPQFFGIAPREAVWIDPQQRLALEVAWEALEDAGTPPHSLAGTATGVFLGIGGHDYVQLLARSVGFERVTPHTGTGGTASVAAGRIAYVLGLQGPVLAVDTACSSSLVALHLACQSLRRQECETALAGGVNLVLAPEVTIAFCRARMLSPDGRCKAFDASADGYGRGEGCGMVVLRRLADAVRNGDRILAVVRGSAVNHDGRTAGLTVPNGPMQTAVIRQALERSAVTATQVSCIEAHGTGTPLGDPIEVGALAAVFEGRSPETPVFLGSVKSNIGHLEAAAGMAGLIKVVLALQHEVIPPHLHFRTPSPHLRWDHLPLRVPTRLTPWESIDGRRLAGVSSFGFSGTNAHVVLEQAPALPAPSDRGERPLHLLCLSAKDDLALDALAERYADHFDRTTDRTGDLCHTAAVGRSHLSNRRAIVGGTNEALRDALRRGASGSRGVARPRQQPAEIAFLFTGQGAQYPGMGKALFETQSTVREALEACDTVLSAEWGRSLFSVIFPASGDESLIDQTQYTQPALFALEYALTALWKSWGVTPSLVLGHSVGEYVAATVAGVWSLEDALRLVALRGRLMQSLPAGGSMAAVGAGEADVRRHLRRVGTGAVVATVNGPAETVIAGTADDVARTCEALEVDGIFTRRLNVSHAFHSPLMDPILEAFERQAASVPAKNPAIALVSNLTGDYLRTAPDGRYWRRHLREPVQFARGIQTMAAAGIEVALEIGPTPVLVSLGRRSAGNASILWLPSLERGAGDWECLFESIAALYTRGIEVDWPALDDEFGYRRVGLPTYAFQRSRYWIDGAGESQITVGVAPILENPGGDRGDPSRGRRLQSPALGAALVVEHHVAASSLLIRDHRIGGILIVPGAFWVSIALSALRAATPSVSALAGVEFVEPMTLGPDEARTVQVVIRQAAEEMSVEIFSTAASVDAPSAAWTLHARARAADLPPPSLAASLEALRQQATGEVTHEAFYAGMAAEGFDLGESLRGIAHIWRTPGGALARLQSRDPGSPVLRRAAMLDSAFQLLGVAIADAAGGRYLPIAADALIWHADPDSELWCDLSVRPTARARRSVEADIQVYDGQGHAVATVTGLQVKQVAGRAAASRPRGDDWLYQVAWRPLDGATRGEPVADTAIEAGPWLVLADAGGVGARLADSLTERGAEVVVVPAIGGGEGDVWPAKLGAARSVVHLGGLDVAAFHANAAGSAVESLRAGCGSLLRLVRSLVEHELAPALFVVTRGAQGLATASVQAAQAPLVGLTRTLAIEQPELRVVSIDLDPDGSAEDQEALAASLRPYGEREIAWRRGRPFVARLAARAAAAPDPMCSVVRPDATYVITGGFGALGVRTAEWLVRCGATTLVLVGRHRRDDNVEALRALGVNVYPVEADVAVRSQVRALVEWVASSLPPLGGIVHAAGVLDDGMIVDLDWDRFARVMSPKIDGAWNLHCETLDLPLDFFVMFSSAASALGSPGQGNYAAANAFLDALAHERRRGARPGLSINWGPWDGDGMAARRRGRKDGFGRIPPLPPERALALLQESLEQDVSQVVALHPGWLDGVRQAAGGSLPPLYDDIAGPAAPAVESETLRLIARTPRDEWPELVASCLGSLVRGILELPESIALDHDRSLNELGLDSLMAVELRTAIAATFGVELPVQVFLRAPSVTRMVDAVVDGLATATHEPATSAPPAPPERAPVSVAQERLWLMDQLSPGNCVYTIPYALHLEGVLDVDVLERSIALLVTRHDALRTVFDRRDRDLVQVVSASASPRLDVMDLRARAAPLADARALVEREAQRPFDLAVGPLWRFLLLVLGDREHVVMVTMQHTVADGWSLGLFLRELTACYRALSAGEAPRFAEVPLTYAQYAILQRQALAEPAFADRLERWRDTFGVAPAPLELATDRPRPPIRSFRGALHSTRLAPELSKRLESFAREHGVTAFTVLIAACGCLLARVTGQDDIVIASPFANRLQRGVDQVIGLFMNPVLLRLSVPEDTTFERLLANVRDTILAAHDHQDLPFEALIDVLQPARDLSRNALFDVMVILQEDPRRGWSLPGFEVDRWPVDTGAAKFDLTFEITPVADGFSLDVEYATDLFDALTVQRMTEQFETLLEGALAAPLAPVGLLPLLTASERAQLVAWQQAPSSAPRSVLHDLFKAQVDRTPDKAAVLLGDAALTYRELDRRATRLARHLTALGVGRGVRVGLCTERSFEMVVGMIGVLKAGGSFVPLDPTYPAERLAYMVADADLAFLATQVALRDRLPRIDGTIVWLDSDDEIEDGEEGAPAVDVVVPEDLAYIIYTSGSTGRPKGVMVPHRVPVGRMQCEPFPFEAGEVIAQKTSLSFVDCIWEVFAPLTRGLTTALVPERDVRDPQALIARLARHGVTRINLVPSLLAVMLDVGGDLARRLPALKYWIATGEPLTEQLAARFRARLPDRRLLNLYGTSEVWDVTSTEAVLPGPTAFVPIGRPLPNVRTYVLDRRLQPVPIGVAGELYVGGDGVALGYWRAAALTEERFVSDPYDTTAPTGLYRTGDRARWLPSGDIALLGRLDQQVKIRGVRVAPEETETALGDHPDVSETVVTARQDSRGTTQLVAYVVRRSATAAAEADLRRWVTERVPPAQVPAAFVFLDALPHTPTGKLDRRALPAPSGDGGDSAPGFVAPRDALELTLCRLWEATLERRPVGVTDNFFDIGGNSLNAAYLRARIAETIGTDVPLATLLQQPTIEALAAAVRAEQPSPAASPLVMIQPAGVLPTFFCVHPAGGEIVAYGPLARALGVDQPFGALQGDRFATRETVPELATRYIDAIRIVQPHGPYFLGGWSFGGLVAFDMAARLIRSGDPVPLLALLDTWPPTPGTAYVDAAPHAILERFAEAHGLDVSTRRLRSLSEDEAFDLVYERARQSRIVPPGTPKAELVTLVDRYRRHAEAAEEYAPPWYPGVVSVLGAADQRLTPAGRALTDWTRHCEQFELVEVPGNHDTIVLEPHVSTLGATLRGLIDQSRSTARLGHATL